jgi:purine nucleosidase/pyrimidine-specific ribonucleoside hydrolase
MKVILDCDPGHDDAFAILLAAASQEIELLGVTTVMGNSYLQNTSKNARAILDFFDIEKPVFAGCSKPLVRNTIIANHIHGSTGFDGAKLPSPKLNIEKIHAIDYIAQCAEKYNNLTLVSTGPLTNIALFILKYPFLCDKISYIVLMGGGIAHGNITPTAEFNIYADPEAAKIVFNSGINIVMAPLDVTHQVVVSSKEINTMRRLSDKFNLLADVFLYLQNTCKDEIASTGGIALHDPCPIMYLIHPEIFEINEYKVDIEIKGELTYGQTVVDVFKVTNNKPNAKVMTKVNSEHFFEIFFNQMTVLTN